MLYVCIYHIVLSKRPWVLTVQASKIGGGRFTRRRCLNGSTIPVQAPTLDSKLSASLLCLCFVFNPKRPEQWWRKLIKLKMD